MALIKNSSESIDECIEYLSKKVVEQNGRL